VPFYEKGHVSKDTGCCYNLVLPAALGMLNSRLRHRLTLGASNCDNQPKGGLCSCRVSHSIDILFAATHHSAFE
jgi:hypothetical protein